MGLRAFYGDSVAAGRSETSILAFALGGNQHDGPAPEAVGQPPELA